MIRQFHVFFSMSGRVELKIKYSKFFGLEKEIRITAPTLVQFYHEMDVHWDSLVVCVNSVLSDPSLSSGQRFALRKELSCFGDGTVSGSFGDSVTSGDHLIYTHAVMRVVEDLLIIQKKFD